MITILGATSALISNGIDSVINCSHDVAIPMKHPVTPTPYIITTGLSLSQTHFLKSDIIIQDNTAIIAIRNKDIIALL